MSKRKKTMFSKTLKLYTILLLILSLIFIGYVYNSMVIYERNLVDNYIKYLATSGKLTEKIDDNLFVVSEYETGNAKITNGVKKLLKSDDLVIKKNTQLSKDGIYVYDLSIGDRIISTVSLKSAKKYTRMAILTIEEWDIVNAETHFENGVYQYEITVPSNYKVYINNNEVKDKDIISEGDVVGLERITNYIEISKNKTYKIDNLVFEPFIKIVDENNKEVKYEVNNNKIIIQKEFQEVANYEDAKNNIKDDFDILKLAENYSLFLTDDLRGTRHGFYTLSPYLIKDSYMYEMAWGWATQVDITFVSDHRLKNPIFTNEKLSNFVFYNDNAFSCEVYLEKNLVVSGKDKIDKMHDRLYFVYYDGGYKLVDMKSLGD